MKMLRFSSIADMLSLHTNKQRLVFCVSLLHDRSVSVTLVPFTAETAGTWFQSEICVGSTIYLCQPFCTFEYKLHYIICSRHLKVMLFSNIYTLVKINFSDFQRNVVTYQSASEDESKNKQSSVPLFLEVKFGSFR